MVSIIWMPQAIKDLERLSNYIEIDSGYYARITIQKIFSAIQHLKKFPHLGRIVPEKNDPNIREILHRNYRIVYRFKDDMIYILTIFHSSFQSGLEHI